MPKSGRPAVSAARHRTTTMTMTVDGGEQQPLKRRLSKNGKKDKQNHTTAPVVAGHSTKQQHPYKNLYVHHKGGGRLSRSGAATSASSGQRSAVDGGDQHSIESASTTHVVLKIGRAFGARMLFVVHSLLTIWQATTVRDNQAYWSFSFISIAILAEGFYTIVTRAGDEHKWFCPSVLLYIMATVPAIWALEMDMAEQRLERGLNVTSCISREIAELTQLEQDLKIPHQLWVQLLEQLLLVFLIVGRWMLPKGLITREQLSQILLAYLAIASDIVELFDLFQERPVTRQKHLQYIILGIWSLSLMQFPFVLTVSRARKMRIAITKASSEEELRRLEYRAKHDNRHRSVINQVLHDIDIWAILLANCFQDIPFLLIRLHLMIAHRVITYTMFFFTCKNLLIIVLQTYRACILIYDRYQKPREQDDAKVLVQHYRNMMIQCSEGLNSLRERRQSLFTNEDDILLLHAVYPVHLRPSPSGLSHHHNGDNGGGGTEEVNASATSTAKRRKKRQSSPTHKKKQGNNDAAGKRYRDNRRHRDDDDDVEDVYEDDDEEEPLTGRSKRRGGRRKDVGDEVDSPSPAKATAKKLRAKPKRTDNDERHSPMPPAAGGRQHDEDEERAVVKRERKTRPRKSSPKRKSRKDAVDYSPTEAGGSQTNISRRGQESQENSPEASVGVKDGRHFVKRSRANKEKAKDDEKPTRADDRERRSDRKRYKSPIQEDEELDDDEEDDDRKESD